METAFISRLKPLLDAVAKTMDVYVPVKVGEYYACRKYDPGGTTEPELNEIRMSPPVKELLFPLRELAAVFPEPIDPQPVKPFAVFGLKTCDLRSMEILDKVFMEKDFEDAFYIARRKMMLTISSDCSSPGESCFCNILAGKHVYVVGGGVGLAPIRSLFLTLVDRIGDFKSVVCRFGARTPEDFIYKKTLFGGWQKLRYDR